MTTITTATRTTVEAKQKAAWSAMRVLHGSPTLDIVRESHAGRDAAKGVSGTVTDSGVSDVPCLDHDVDSREIQLRGLNHKAAPKNLVCWDIVDDDNAFTVRLTDKIVFQGDRYDIESVKPFPSGRVEIFVTLAREP